MPFRDEVRRHIPHGVQSAIREMCNAQYTFVDRLLYLELPQICKVTLDENPVSDAIDAIGVYDGMEKDLNRHVSILDAKLNSLRAWELPIQEMIEVLSNR